MENKQTNNSPPHQTLYSHMVAAPIKYPNQLAIAKAMVAQKIMKMVLPTKENMNPKLRWNLGATAQSRWKDEKNGRGWEKKKKISSVGVEGTPHFPTKTTNKSTSTPHSRLLILHSKHVMRRPKKTTYAETVICKEPMNMLKCERNGVVREDCDFKPKHSKNTERTDSKLSTDWNLYSQMWRRYL